MPARAGQRDTAERRSDIDAAVARCYALAAGDWLNAHRIRQGKLVHASAWDKTNAPVIEFDANAGADMLVVVAAAGRDAESDVGVDGVVPFAAAARMNAHAAAVGMTCVPHEGEAS